MRAVQFGEGESGRLRMELVEERDEGGGELELA